MFEVNFICFIGHTQPHSRHVSIITYKMTIMNEKIIIIFHFGLRNGHFSCSDLTSNVKFWHHRCVQPLGMIKVNGWTLAIKSSYLNLVYGWNLALVHGMDNRGLFNYRPQMLAVVHRCISGDVSIFWDAFV